LTPLISNHQLSKSAATPNTSKFKKGVTKALAVSRFELNTAINEAPEDEEDKQEDDFERDGPSPLISSNIPRTNSDDARPKVLPKSNYLS
jgi:hypothetical protein